MPAAIEAVIHGFDVRDVPFTEHHVQQALSEARTSLEAPSDGESYGAWSEVFAFSLLETRPNWRPWGTYFGPIGSGTNSEGKTIYFPDISGADTQLIENWATRAKNLTHPILVARYADSVWDLASVVAKGRRDPEMARIAIDAYLASAIPQMRTERYDQFTAVLRALEAQRKSGSSPPWAPPRRNGSPRVTMVACL